MRFELGFYNDLFSAVQIVEMKEKKDHPTEMDYVFYLANVKPSSVDSITNEESTVDVEFPKMYLKVMSLIEFDTFVITHGPGTYVDGKKTFHLSLIQVYFKTDSVVCLMLKTQIFFYQIV